MLVYGRRRGKITMTDGSNLLLTIWKPVPLSFHECFIFSSQGPPSYFSSFLIIVLRRLRPLLLKQLSSLRFSTLSFNLSVFICSLSRPSSRPHSINLFFLHFLSHASLSSVSSSTSCEPLSTPLILPSGNSVMLLPYRLSCPVFALVSCSFR